MTEAFVAKPLSTTWDDYYNTPKVQETLSKLKQYSNFKIKYAEPLGKTWFTTDSVPKALMNDSDKLITKKTAAKPKMVKPLPKPKALKYKKPKPTLKPKGPVSRRKLMALRDRWLAEGQTNKVHPYSTALSQCNGPMIQLHIEDANSVPYQGVLFNS